MNILNEKKEVTPIITPSFGYKLRSINWNEDFYFDNPIYKFLYTAFHSSQ